MDRSQQVNRLQNESFDLCIIGGGASGTGAALDAALRGLKVALVEQEDFAAGTSSKSTKLIHGGVRYLEQAFMRLDFGQLRQVRHGLEERYTLIRNAPFLAHPLPLLTPCRNWWEGFYFSIGLRLYDWFAKGDPLPKSRWISRKAALKRVGGLHPQLHSAVLYFDGQLDDARYCLLLAKTAVNFGAAVANHLVATGFECSPTGVLQALRVRDTTTGTSFRIQAKVFLNCAGAGADAIRQLANPELAPRISQSKGVHAVVPLHYLGSDSTALLIPKTTDGRIIFAIPWAGKLLLGTTDSPYQESREPLLEKAEVDFLLENLNPYLKQAVKNEELEAGFGGIRPLIAAGTTTTTKTLLRDHAIEIDPVSKLVSLLGGKWTTYRLMAQDAIDAIAAILEHHQPARTRQQPLAGAEGYTPEGWHQLQCPAAVDPTVVAYLWGRYGTRSTELLALLEQQPELASPLSPAAPYLAVEVIYAVTAEMACTLRDVLARRLRLESTSWATCLQVAPAVGALMASQLGWDATTTATAVAEYQDLIHHFQARSATSDAYSSKP